MSLEKLGAVFAQHDLESKQAAHNQAADTIQEVRAELKGQLGGSDPEMDVADRQQVSESYEQVAREDVQRLLNDDFTLDEFPEQIDTVSDELREILRSPQAETVVEAIFEWLLATGLPPLSEDTQDELRVIIKNDIETARQAVHDAKAAHDSLRGYLGSAQEDIDQLILDAIENTSSVGELESLARGLTQLRESWVGDWELEFSTEAGESLYRDILNYLEEQLAEEVSSGNSINGIAARLGKKSERWGRQLDKISNEWKRVENLATQIEHPDGTYDAEDALEQINSTIGPASSINRYLSVLQKATTVLNKLDNARRVELDAYSTSSDDIPSEISDEVETVQEAAMNMGTLLDESFAAENLQTIEERVDELEKEKTDLEEAFEELRKTITSQVETTRRLARKFDLQEQQGRLNTILANSRNAETTGDLISLFKEYQNEAEAVREPVRDQLSESQELLFTFLLQNSEDETYSAKVWNAAVDELDGDRGELLNDLAELDEMGLVGIEIGIQ
jgi:exonuclease VII small subunit